MTPNELLTVVAQVAGLLGIMGSMFGNGPGPDHSPNRHAAEERAPGRAGAAGELRAGAPARLMCISLIIPLEDSLKIGLMVLALSAGAPFLMLEARGAKANLGLAVGVMTLLMVVTIFFLPLVLPLLLTGVEVDAGAIAKSLIVLMLIPLILGLLVRANAPDTAQHWMPVMNKIGSLGIMILLVVGLGLNVSNVFGLIGSGGFLALLLFIVGSLAIGLLIGGRDPGVRNVMGLGTAQRNVSAAIVVTLANFAGTNAVPFVLVASILIPLILLPTARWLGRRSEPAPLPVEANG